MNHYLTYLLHKLTLVTGQDDTTVTEYALLYLAAGLEPADSDKPWIASLQGVPKMAGNKEILKSLETAREFYLQDVGGEV